MKIAITTEGLGQMEPFLSRSVCVTQDLEKFWHFGRNTETGWKKVLETFIWNEDTQKNKLNDIDIRAGEQGWEDSPGSCKWGGGWNIAKVDGKRYCLWYGWIVVEEEKVVEEDSDDDSNDESDIGWINEEEWDSGVARNFMKFFLSPLSQNVTLTNPNLFGPAVSEHSLQSLKETDGQTVDSLPVCYAVPRSEIQIHATSTITRTTSVRLLMDFEKG